MMQPARHCPPTAYLHICVSSSGCGAHFVNNLQFKESVHLCVERDISERPKDVASQRLGCPPAQTKRLPCGWSCLCDQNSSNMVLTVNQHRRCRISPPRIFVLSFVPSPLSNDLVVILPVCLGLHEPVRNSISYTELRESLSQGIELRSCSLDCTTSTTQRLMSFSKAGSKYCLSTT
jgi:hypothetical protein